MVGPGGMGLRMGKIGVVADGALHNPSPSKLGGNPTQLVDSDSPDIDISFMHAFIASLCIIIVSELGDKTFFISAIMAMSHPRMTVFAGAMTALAGMHVLSGELWQE